MEEEGEFFLRSNKKISGYSGIDGSELQWFRSCLKWMCVDQSNPWSSGLSWSIFFLLAAGVPFFSHYFLLSCFGCDEKHARPYDAILQLSLSSLAALSFITLSGMVNKYGIRRLLFLDKLSGVSEEVRLEVIDQFHVCFSLFTFFLLSAFELCVNEIPIRRDFSLLLNFSGFL